MSVKKAICRSLIAAAILINGLTPALAEPTAGSPQTERDNFQPAHGDAVGKSQLTLKLGIYPYTVTTRIVPVWQPLAKFLEQQLQQPVVIVSAINSQQFTQRAERGDYFLFLSAPHISAWLDREGSANRVRQFVVPLYSQLLTLKQSDYDGLEDLVGKTIATVNQGTFIAELLDYRIAKLRTKQSFQATIDYRPSHASAFRALLNGSADAAFIAPIPHPHLHDLNLNSIKIVERSALNGNAMLMAPNLLGVAHARRMAMLVDKFQSEDQHASTLLTGFLDGVDGKFKPVTDADIDNLMPLVNNWQSAVD